MQKTLTRSNPLIFPPDVLKWLLDRTQPKELGPESSHGDYLWNECLRKVHADIREMAKK